MKRLAVAGLILLVSCSERTPLGERPAETRAALGGSVAARVGGDAIPLSLVEAVANAQHIDAKDAARKVIDDEVAAGSARKRGLDQKNPTSWNLKAVRAKLTTDRLHLAAKNAGPPTDEEVARISKIRWAEVDRPPTVRVMHAIALRPKDAGKTTDAKKIAEALLEATREATTDEDFKTRAKAVDHPKEIETRVEDLPPFTNEGLVPGGGAMDAKFAEAAYALPKPGAQTALVETRFGWHVIRLLERLPELRMPLEDRRRAFAEEVVAMRGRDAVTVLMSDLQSKVNIEISPAAASLMQSVPIKSEDEGSP